MRKRHDTPETNRAFIVLTAIICVILLVLNSKVEAAEWFHTPPVEYINEGSPIESAKVEEAIDYVVWSWGLGFQRLTCAMLV